MSKFMGTVRAFSVVVVVVRASSLDEDAGRSLLLLDEKCLYTCGFIFVRTV